MSRSVIVVLVLMLAFTVTTNAAAQTKFDARDFSGVWGRFGSRAGETGILFGGGCQECGEMPAQLRNQTPEAIDAFNERLLIALQRDGSSYLSNATLGGRFALRGCVLNYRTTLHDMEILLDDLRRVAKALLISA